MQSDIFYTPIQTQQPNDPFALYRQVSDTGETRYSAGFPSYPANFSRDTIIAGIISARADLLAAQLEISARNQGRIVNHETGELPGRIHHELPGVKLEDRDTFTTFSACDTTALFLIATEGLMQLDQAAYTAFMSRHEENINRAIDYLMKHVDEANIFWERTPEGSDRHGLKVTYWKDSILPHPNGKLEPDYPVTFSLAHFMTARATLSASRITNNDMLACKAHAMYMAGIQEFIRREYFVVYRDRSEQLEQCSSDEMHALAFIPQQYMQFIPLDAVRNRAEELATPFGYMCTPHHIAQHLADQYHGDKVWTHEQALIHYGASKFGLDYEASVAAGVANYIGEGQELLGVERQEAGLLSPIPEGNSHQLWSVAAREYFNGRSALQTAAWL